VERAPFSEGALTSLRREAKLVMRRDEAAALAARLARDAGPVESRIAAVYFDGPAAPLARRAVARPDDCVKVRVKAYHPDRSAIPGRVVLEVKRERAGLTSKERLWLRREEVADALRAVAPGHGVLAPLVATSYRRVVYQPGGAWRVTIDDALTFYPASWALFAPGAPAWAAGLGPPVGREERVVVELKHTPGALPPWLEALARAAVPYSKFAEAVARAAALRSKGA
jgi:hypothetical protein